MERLYEILKTVLKNRGISIVYEINSNSHLRNDLCLDSLDLAELTVRIEAEYGLDIFDDGIVNTVGEIEDKIKSL